MKTLLLVASLLLSFSAMAAWNEVECEGRFENKNVSLEVEQPFPNGSYFKRASLTVAENGSEKTEDYTVSSRLIRGFNRIEYTAPGLRLEVDFWPDQRPRWGMRYRGTILSSTLGNKIQFLDCTFPNAY